MIVQSDVFPDDHGSVIVCQITSALEDAPDFRVTIEPSKSNGLLRTSQIMVDKLVTVRRRRIGSRIGRLEDREVRRLNRARAFVMGLAD